MVRRYRVARYIRVLGLIAGMAAASLVAMPSAQGAPPPISSEPLTERHAFTDDVSIRVTQQLQGLEEQVVPIDDASHLIVVRFTIQPGAVFPWHTHPGTVLISIAEGDLVFIFAEDCVRREYGPGSALVDPGDAVHTALNPSADQETVVMAVLLGAPAEGPLTIHVDDAEGAALDEKCDIERDAP